MLGDLQAVLFDMDGLLVDTEHGWGVVEDAVMQWLGGGVWTDADKADAVGGPLSEVAVTMIERAESKVTGPAVVQRLVDEMAEWLKGGADHRPGAEQLLDDLRAHAIPTALVSSSPRILVDAVLDSVGSAHFALTIAGDEVPRTKPFPDPYLLACERLGVNPSQVIVLEDSPVGIAAAEAAGCVAVGIPFAVPLPAARRRHIIGSLADLTTERLRELLAQTPQ